MAQPGLRISLFLLLILAASCSSPNHSSSPVIEDRLYITRHYIGDFLESRSTPADKYGNPDLIWITTTGDSIRGRIAAYGRECSFKAGDRLYLRRIGEKNPREIEWVYIIENEESVQYMINEYQNHRDVPVESWFNSYPDTPLQTAAPEQKPVADTPEGL